MPSKCVQKKKKGAETRCIYEDGKEQRILRWFSSLDCILCCLKGCPGYDTKLQLILMVGGSGNMEYFFIDITRRGSTCLGHVDRSNRSL